MEDERERFAELISSTAIAVVESIQNIITGFRADQHRINHKETWTDVGRKLYDFTERK